MTGTPPPAMLRAIERGWTGLVVVEDAAIGEGGPVTLLHAGRRPDPERAHLGLATRGDDGAPVRFLRVWLCDGRCAGGPPPGCTTDLAYRSGRRRSRTMADTGRIVLWTARPGEPASLRRGVLPLSGRARDFLRDATARAGEHFPEDPPPFGVSGPRWRLLAERAPCFAEAGEGREEVLLVVPADTLQASAEPVGAVSFTIDRGGGGMHLLTHLWRPDRETTLSVDIGVDGQWELAMRLPEQGHLHVVAVERGTGRIAETLRASLAPRGDGPGG